MDTNVGNNFEFQQIGNRTTTTTVIITFPSQEGICCFTNNHFQKKLSHSYWELCLLASSTSPPSPCAHTASHHFMGFLCSRHAWQVNLNRFTVLSPPYITGSVLAHSDSHPVSVSLFFFFRLHFDSRLLSRCLHLLVTAASQPDKTEANCPWDLIQIHLSTNSL